MRMPAPAAVKVAFGEDSATLVKNRTFGPGVATAISQSAASVSSVSAALIYLPVTPASSCAFSTCGRGIEMMLYPQST
jgi:hypothetical protein